MAPNPRPDPTVIGSVSTPPFAVLPDPDTLFAARARRLRTYAAVSPLKPYLEFLAGLVEAQQAIVSILPPVDPPTDDQVARAASYAMPPLDRLQIARDATVQDTLDALFGRVASLGMPKEAATALQRVTLAGEEPRAAMMRDVLAHSMPAETLADHVFVAAALQVHFARLAAALDARRLVPVGDGACPACGGAPVASLVVEWQNVHGNRFCVCSMCSTLWNYVRIRCCSCGTTKGIGYQEIEGTPGTVKAETCDECRTYVKVMYQNKDTTIEAVADDVGTLALDMMMRDGPYRRAAFNPFLLGY